MAYHVHVVQLQVVAFGGEEGFDDMPFSGDSPRSTERGCFRRRISDDDAVEALQRLRSELEVGGNVIIGCCVCMGGSSNWMLVFGNVVQEYMPLVEGTISSLCFNDDVVIIGFLLSAPIAVLPACSADCSYTCRPG
jgi:hypothetical protein